MITSAQNPRLQRIRALLEKRKQRESEGAFVIEGVRLAEEALAAGWTPELVLYASRLSQRGSAVTEGFSQAGAEVLEVADHLIDSLSGTETSQGLLAVVPQRSMPLPEQRNFLVIADTLRDPGNLGTMLRTAAAAGAQGVLLSPATTDAFSPKVLRAGMGAHFRLPILAASWEEIATLCAGLRVLIAEAEEGISLWQTDLRTPLALLISSEAEGASPQALALPHQTIRIPMPGRSESLNAAIAAGILLFEVVRQRETM